MHIDIKDFKDAVRDIAKDKKIPKVKKDEDATYKNICRLLRDGRNIFITGGGGVGKSYTLKRLCKEFDITLTSTTGISALNIGGQTLHSWSGIGLGNKSLDIVIKSIKDNKKKLIDIQSTKILAIDEISMLNAGTLDYINTVLKEVIGSYKSFGGIQVILIGDFFQLPPVKIGELDGNGKLIDFCFNSNTWRELNLETIYLQKVFRQSDTKLIKVLNDIREGDKSSSDIFYKCKCNPSDDCIRLYSTNKEVDGYNEYKYIQIHENEYVYNAIDKIKIFVNGKNAWVNPDTVKLSEKDKLLYASFDQNCRLQKIIKLKKGARVMLLQNVDVKGGLVNGSCGYIHSLSENEIKIKFDNGRIFALEPFEFVMEQNGLEKIVRKQFPVSLAWAVSIHKSQGCTFDKIFVDFSRIFTFGQAYVALSRVKTLDGLFIRNFNPDKIAANPRVVEFYRDFLIKY